MKRKQKIKKKSGKKVRKDKLESSKKKPVPQKYFFGKISKVFLAGTFALVVFYLAAGFAASPHFLKNDLKEKYGKVLGAVNVSILVRGMPVKPVVTAVSGCSDFLPYIDLDWGDDLGVDTYDVYRDGALLIAGITASSYQDSNVTALTSYSYYVVANGPVGTQQSDTVTIQASDCYTPPPPPPPPPPPASLTITRLDVIDLTNFRCAAKTNKTRPTFSGTTNMAGARIAVEIDSGRKIRKVFSTFWANGNGYWSWKSKGKLKTGAKTVYLTAYDSSDATRSATASLQFRVVKKKPSKKFLKKCRITSLLPTGFGNIRPPMPLQPEFSLEVEKETKVVHQGEEVNFSLFGPERQSAANLRTGILDGQGNIIFEKNGGAKNEIKIDEKLPAGDYKLFVRYVSDDRDVSAEDDFEVKEKPLLVLGSGHEITRRQILSNLGWAAFFSLGLLGIFLFLLLLEYHLSRRAILQITGSDLKKKGMID